MVLLHTSFSAVPIHPLDTVFNSVYSSAVFILVQIIFTLLLEIQRYLDLQVSTTGDLHLQVSRNTVISVPEETQEPWDISCYVYSSINYCTCIYILNFGSSAVVEISENMLSKFKMYIQVHVHSIIRG